MIDTKNLQTQYYIERKILQCLIHCSDMELKELSALLKKSKSQQNQQTECADLMNEFLVVIFREGIHTFQTELIEHILFRLMDKIGYSNLHEIEDPNRYLGMLKNLEVNLKITVIDPLTQKLKASVSLEEEKQKAIPKLIPFDTILPIKTPLIS